MRKPIVRVNAYRTRLVYGHGLADRFTYFNTKREAERDNRENVRLYGSASAWIERRAGGNYERIK